MGRIKKTAGPKHEATISPAISKFVSKASSIPISELPAHLDTFPKRWPLPRGDLYHWIPLLNRFDNILEQFIKEYGLDNGPQSKPFGTTLLERGVAEEKKDGIVKATAAEELESFQFGAEGDRQLVEHVLQASRMLLENCGNRSLYGSSERLSELLNTTDLSLLSNALQLMVRLAQRYHASRQRTSSANQSFNNALLVSHYNIDLEKVQKIAEPFVKVPSSSPSLSQTPSGRKGKEKSISSRQESSANANDMLSLLQVPPPSVNGSAKSKSSTRSSGWVEGRSAFEEWGGVALTYYPTSTTTKEEAKAPTPTPSRRISHVPKPSRLSSSGDGPEVSHPINGEESESAKMARVDLHFNDVRLTTPDHLMHNRPRNLPKDAQYDLLTRVRIAHSVTSSPEDRQELVAIRLLALTNLAYIYTEENFKQKILQRDSDEPRNLQLIQQLCDMLHPPASKPTEIPVRIQTLALGTLEAFAKLKAKAADVCSSLSINVNHGVLFFLLRKAVADMRLESATAVDIQLEEWREAVFALLDTLPTSGPRTAEALVSAGLLEILVEVLHLRTSKAERGFPKTLTFLNGLVGPVRDIFQTLSNVSGLEAISDLMAYEVDSSMERAKNGQGLQPEYRNRMVDYQIPFFSQQTLRMIFKIIREMMTHNSGNFDRLLRNFIDSPSLLSGLRTVIVNSDLFGSSVWSGAVNIMSSFIHNEPTSYAVISEAGLSRGLLEALSTKGPPAAESEGGDNATADGNAAVAWRTDDGRELPTMADTETLMTFFTHYIPSRRCTENAPLAKGILPATDAIVAIPHALGALCLNHAGMDMLKQTNALDNYFEIFESPAHIKAMLSDQGDLGEVVGQSMEELVRHHPSLKIPVLASAVRMINKVKALCLEKGKAQKNETKLWLQQDSEPVHAGQKAETEADGDVIMGDAAEVRSDLHKDSDEDIEPSISTFIDVAMRFLSAFTENPTSCGLLVDTGVAETVLDIATLPVLDSDFNSHEGAFMLMKTLGNFAEHKPHLVIPAILQRLQTAVERLAPLHGHTASYSFFAEFTTPGFVDSNKSKAPSHAAIGTTLAKSLATVQFLSNVCSSAFSPHNYNSSRSTQTAFSQVNLTDQYVKLVKDLGSLHRVCTWEEILLMRRLPESWVKPTQIRGPREEGSAERILGLQSPEDDAASASAPSVPVSSISSPPASSAFAPESSNDSSPSPRTKTLTAEDENSAAFRNARTLRNLLCQVPAAITPFLQSLGKCLLGKRRAQSSDTYLRQNASKVADAIASAYIELLEFLPLDDIGKMPIYSYRIVALTSTSKLLIEGSSPRSQSQVLTLLLQSFRCEGGLDIVSSILQGFKEEVDSLSDSAGGPVSKENAACLLAAYRGIQVILKLYTPMLSHKSIVDASQSEALRSAETHPGHAYYFNPHSFLVELQVMILPVVKSLWDSNFVEKASSEIVRSVIELMKIVLDSSEEHGVPRQNPENAKPKHKIYDINRERLSYLKQKDIDEDLAREALYRCMNVQASALAYCYRVRNIQGAQRYPIPEYDKQGDPTKVPAILNEEVQSLIASGPTVEEPVYDNDTSDAAAGLALLRQGDRPTQSLADLAQVAVEEADNDGQPSNETAPPPAPGLPALTASEVTDQLAMSLDNLQNMLPDVQNMLPDVQDEDANDIMRRLTENFRTSRESEFHPSPQANLPPSTTPLEDLNAQRSEVRKSLVDRALDVVNVHEDVTFELADLIGTATSKSPDVKAIRAEIGATLIQSLISFELGDDSSAGKKIAATANLLALVLQNKEFFDACSNELRDNFEYLIQFIAIPQNQIAGMSTTPWLAQTLLVIEKVLAEDAQPLEIKWTHPEPDGQSTSDFTTDPDPSSVAEVAKADVFEALLKLMPCTGRDESIVLSIIRVLVILTRNRNIASKLAEKKNIQRFFVMIKQLSGISDERLTSSVMIVVRHMFEDDHMIRRLIQSEIRNNFETRPNRPTDAQSYARQLNHLAIRSPQIFVEVSNEVLEISGYDSASRPQFLKLKVEEVKEPESELEAPAPAPDAAPEKDKTPTEDAVMEDNNASVQSDQASNAKPKAIEKAPILENPSGVIHYLLSELLSYKDTDDSVSSLAAKFPNGDGSATPSVETPSSANLEIENATISIDSTSATPNPLSPTPPEAKKVELKPEQHPIHTYRCFLLQCLTELLHSYNQAKVEFINFSRKVDTKATPSKPHSGILNYLLNEAVPLGTLLPEDTLAYKKKDITSTWATSAIVALCMRTNEHGYDRKTGTIGEDDQADLVFVRKFVLEQALKAYKDANNADEDLNIKYGRLLSLADLFNALLSGALLQKPGTHPSPHQVNSARAVAKFMFEKNFIAAFTNSIADINLNLKGADRAIKHILRPLKLLTSTAVDLSESSSISTPPGHTDDDDISSATSNSEVNDGREETPDLFRNSTLGMFEPNREDESSSESSRSEDDEMYDDGYDDGMDYGDEMDEPENDGVISDEDEELGNVGQIEGFHGDGSVPMEMEVMMDDGEGSDPDDEDDDPEDSAEDDDDDELDELGEVNGDDENASLADGDEEDWQDELDDQDENQETQDQEAENAVRDIVREFGGPEAALQRLNALEGGPSNLVMDVDEGRYMDDVVRHDDGEENEEEEDDEEEEMDEDLVGYEPEYDDEQSIMPDPPWGWGDPDDEPFPHDHHRHHTHRHHISRHLPDPWTIFPNGPPSRGPPLYRSHRTPTTNPRTNDDGMNPLLQQPRDRHARSSLPRRHAFSDHISDTFTHGMEFMTQGGRGGVRDSPVTMIHNLLAAIGGENNPITAVTGPTGNVHISIAGEGHDPTTLTRGVQAMMSRSGHVLPFEPSHSSQTSQLTSFVPQTTWYRWTEEAKMLFGANDVQNRGQRVTNSLLRLMVPPAIEKRKKQEEEDKLKQEALAKKREEDRKIEEEKEQEEREKREKAEQEAAAEAATEAQARAEVEAEEAAANALGTAETLTSEGIVANEGDMEGIETEAAQPESTGQVETGEGEQQESQEPAEPQPVERRFVDFNGAPLDITNMDIDPDYLEALPEELRTEVLTSQIATQRSQTATTTGEGATTIDTDFLEALPPEIRAELLQQEAQLRRQRDREETRRQQATTGGPAHAEEIDTASFLASLDPALRQHVLMEQDEDMLAHLPPDIAAEARALGGDRHVPRFGGGPRIARPTGFRSDILRRAREVTKKNPRKQIVQMLDKPGVATLLRLMFMQQPNNIKTSLYPILNDIAQNRTNRAEVVSLLLSLLQDGSADVNAVERSYGQFSLRAKQATPARTPLKRITTDNSVTTVTGLAELKVTPLMVIQQCLSSLVYLTLHNRDITTFFLTENDIAFVVKTKANKKGKNKETKASRYPINALLGLLDRQLITENMACVEQLAELLQRITHPLNMLLKKDKDPADEENKDEKNDKKGSAPTSPEQANDNPTNDDDQAPATVEGERAATEASTAQTITESANASGVQSNTATMADVQPTNDNQEQSPVEAVDPPLGAAYPAASEGRSGIAEAKADAETAPSKKTRQWTPPTIPEENLRLVVNIIVARECPSNTFRATLSTMTNLCALEGAKDVFGKRLVDAALELGANVLNDLNQLIPQIKAAKSGTDLQGMALTKFSPHSSDQAKLLRVLKALDYLFDPKRDDKKTKSDTEKKEAAEASASRKVDLVTSLYEDSNFSMLWDKLGECLTAIRQGTGMLNVATILLPLVEALMVVCTNTTIKEAPLSKTIKQFAVTSPPPESRMESLFFRFTEEHRKILNDLVRQNPKLMSGTFQLLVQNPKVLEFDNKRNYFTRRVHQRGTEARHPQPPLQLSVRRQNVFLESFRALYYKSGDEIKYGKLSIRFNGEEGVDAGGVTREWFQVLSRQMFNADYALFIPVASDRTTFHPNKLSKVNDEHLMYFRFIGCIIGKALYEGRALDCHFSRAVYKRILGKTVSIKDMETLDLDYYKSLLWMLENDISDIITETMSVEVDDFGEIKIIDLVPNGRNIPVSEENKHEYVQLVVEYRLTGSVEDQLEKFLKGFHEIVPPELISIFNEQELELLISGLPDIDVDDWKSHSEYHNYQAASPQIQWFWRAVRSFDKEERAKLLQFVTGTSKVPLNGFGQLEGMNGFSRFNIHRDYGNKERLPSSHTCFNQLDLPEYEDYETLRKQVYTAMTAGSEYFGFA